MPALEVQLIPAQVEGPMQVLVDLVIKVWVVVLMQNQEVGLTQAPVDRPTQHQEVGHLRVREDVAMQALAGPAIQGQAAVLTQALAVAVPARLCASEPRSNPRKRKKFHD
jgi:hypothetical protein